MLGDLAFFNQVLCVLLEGLRFLLADQLLYYSHACQYECLNVELVSISMIPVLARGHVE